MRPNAPHTAFRPNRKTVSKTDLLTEVASSISPLHKAAINHLFTAKKKLKSLDQKNSIGLDLQAIEKFLTSIPNADSFSIETETRLTLEIAEPQGKYDITRTDCDAKVTGDCISDPDSVVLIIKEIYKPAISLIADTQGDIRKKIIQPAVVEVEARPKHVDGENES